ncbi:MAG: hypothetical protein WAT71_12150 [Ignavibacteria bacterium]
MDENNTTTLKKVESVISQLGNNHNFPDDFIIIEKFISDYYNFSISERENQNFEASYQFISTGFNLCNNTLIQLKKILEENRNEKIKIIFDQKIFETEIQMLRFNSANNFTTGLFHFSNRNPGLANQFFSESEKNSKELYNKTKDNKFTIESELSKNYKHMSEGLEKTLTGDLIDARKNYQLAKIGFEDIIKKLHQEKTEENNLLKTKIEYVCRECSNMLFIANAQYYFRSKNYNLSIENYDKLILSYKQTITDFSGIDSDTDTDLDEDSDPGLESLKNFYQGNYFYYNGHLNIVKGLHFQESNKWDDALESFEKVRTDWIRATEFLLKSNIPQALTLQETISQNEFSIDQYISSCIKDRDQLQKINELEEKVKMQQEELFNMLKPAGITVNNIQDINNTVEQNVQIVQKIEYKTRENIKELLELLKTVPINESDKKDIESEGKELVESKEKGVKFLDKAKSYTEKISGIIKNAGEIATPIIPIVKALALMLA